MRIFDSAKQSYRLNEIDDGGGGYTMRTDKKIISEMERLFKEYDDEVEKRKKEGILKNTTARTYLSHAENFVRWCKEEFTPGITKLRNSNKNQRS